MPTLPLPPITGQGVAIDSGDLPVASTADITAVWSEDVMQVEVAPIRDAIIAGQLAALLAYQRASRYAAAQSDRLRATGEYLDEIGEEQSINRASSNEDDTTYRSRVNTPKNTVDPNDIIAAANEILAPFTPISARYYEHSDGVFASNPATTTWSSHAFQPTDGGPNATPNYPDRYYALLPNRRPSGQVAFLSSYGRQFTLRVPEISLIDTTVSAAYQLGNPLPPETPAAGGGNFAGQPADGVLALNITFAWNITATADQVYDAIVDAVEAIRGHSIRWSMLSDPNLTA